MIIFNSTICKTNNHKRGGKKFLNLVGGMIYLKERRILACNDPQ
jgi:hypothetical protein